MIVIPDFHDGLWISQQKVVRLFLRTRIGERSTVVLQDVERLSTSNVFVGNIILDVALVEPSKLTITHIEQVYWPQEAKVDVGTAQKLLGTAQEKSLWALEITPSYGAEGTALFKTIEMSPGHVLL